MAFEMRECLRQLFNSCIVGQNLDYLPPFVSPATSCELVRVDLTDLIEKGIPVLLTRTYGE